MKRKLRGNLKLAFILLLIPVITGFAIIVFIFTDSYRQGIGRLGAERLETDNWQSAKQEFDAALPEFERKFAYYQVKERQNLASVSNHFSVPEEKLASLNPGHLVAGTTVKITPLEYPLKEVATTNGKISQAKVIEEKGALRIKNDFKFERIVTNFSELAEFLRPHGAIIKTGEKSYRIVRPISVEDNIRLDITSSSVEKLELLSEPNKVVCLCAENIEMLIKGVQITSYDPALDGPDIDPNDQRSFIRVLKSTRMDIINSDLSYLGNGLDISEDQLQREGGTYGISWRIPDDRLGQEIVTGWVEGNRFYKNYFGSYTFGASGMVWKNNHYLENDIYGLDPHDDSNNALVEDNIFERNGRHGFIVSKRCNYNIIRNNVSFGNTLHGFMLHQDSVYNLIENNVAYNNSDNFAIFASDFNAVRGNKSYNARNNHMRVNEGSANIFITNNEFYGGKRGLYFYGGAQNVLADNNIIQTVDEVLVTNGAKNLLLSNNTIQGLQFRMADGDRIIFGTNSVNTTFANSPPSGAGEIRRSKDEPKTNEPTNL